MANSSGMNGIGANSVIKAVTTKPVATVITLAWIFCVAYVAFLGLRIWKGIQFKKSEAYTQYKEFKKSAK
jgi:hypothetical protein